MCIEKMLLKQLRMKRKIKQWCSTIVSIYRTTICQCITVGYKKMMHPEQLFNLFFTLTW